MNAGSRTSILITGGTGQVGGALAQLLPHALVPTRAQLDLTNPDSIRLAIRTLRPRWILNPAAYTAVDQAESEPQLARAINTDAVAVIGEEARAAGAVVLHFSTDYVFSGTGSRPYVETDATGPLGVYGATKLAGEQALAASGAAHLILRTSWVYGPVGRNFLLTVLRVAREREEMRIVDDQHGAPTAAGELANLSLHLMNHCESLVDTQDDFSSLAQAMAPVCGLYHATAKGHTTWFGFAQEVLRLRREVEPDVRFARLVPIPTSGYPTPAQRPLNSRLDCSSLARTFGYEGLPWQQGLARVSAQVGPAG